MFEQTPAWVQEEDAGHEQRLLKRERVSDIIHLANEPIEFVIQGFLIDGTHGMLAGPDKSLKSYIGTFIDLSVISGVTLFGTFPVERTGPVVAYVGEGGEKPYLRRVKRIAAAMGVEWSVLDDYHILTQTAPINSPVFQKTLERDLAEVRPLLVRMDPYYAYHGGEADARNLYQEGANLNMMSEPCTEAGANLLITNHFNQTSRGGLTRKRITMAGGAEWVDSWILVEKTSDDDQNVAFGHFKLNLAIGSRQWGETRWTLGLDIGYFDQLAGDHNGTISWTLTSETKAIDGSIPKKLLMRRRAIEILTEHPWEKSKSDLAKAMGVGNQGERLAFLDSELKRTGETQLFMQRTIPFVIRNGATRNLPRMGLNPTHGDAPDGYPLVPGNHLA